MQVNKTRTTFGNPDQIWQPKVVRGRTNFGSEKWSARTNFRVTVPQATYRSAPPVSPDPLLLYLATLPLPFHFSAPPTEEKSLSAPYRASRRSRLGERPGPDRAPISADLDPLRGGSFEPPEPPLVTGLRFQHNVWTCCMFSSARDVVLVFYCLLKLRARF